MSSMSHRERVLKTLLHEEPDRIPRDLMGNATMILDDAYFSLRDHLGLSPIDPVRRGSTANYYDPRILEYFDIDFRRVFLPANRENSQIDEHEDGTFTDQWGIRFKKEGIFLNAVAHPLAEKETTEEIQKYRWPKAEEMFSAAGIKEVAKELYFNTDYAIVARNPLNGGFIDRSCQLMGTENFLTALIVDPGLVMYILENIFQTYASVYSMFLDEAGEYVHMVETADDIGTQNSLLISPHHYHQYIKPFEKKLYALIHKKAPHAALFRHTDGSVFPLIPDFIDVGIDVLNPVQTSSRDMEGEKLKKTYGREITFHGAIESLSGPVETIEADVQRIMRIFKPGGGYIFAPCNHIIDARPEAVLSVYAAADKYGAY